MRLFIDMAYKKTIALVEEKRELITAMAELLLSKEVRVVYSRVGQGGVKPLVSLLWHRVD